MNFASWLPFNPRILAGILVTITILSGFKNGYFSAIPKARPFFNFKRYGAGLLVLAVFFCLIIPFDTRLLNFIQSDRPVWVEALSRIGVWLNRNVEFWIVITGVYLTALAAGRRGLAVTFFSAFLASALTGLAGHVLKFVFLRARPYSFLGPFSFFNAGGFHENRHAFQSLPSGDVALIAGAAAFFFFAVRRLIFRLPFLILPVCAALQRITDDKHWPSDTAASIGLGFLIAHAVWTYQQNSLACSGSPIPAQK